MKLKKTFLLLAVLFGISVAFFYFFRAQNHSIKSNTVTPQSQMHAAALNIEIASGPGDQGVEAPSLLKLSDGTTISDIGFGVELVKQEEISDNKHIFILKSRPCTDCDIPAELLVYFLEARKKHGVIFPGKFTNVGSEQIDDIATGFFGNCGAPYFHILIFHKWIDPNYSESWQAEKIDLYFTSEDIVENQVAFEVSEFDSRVIEVEKAQNCQKLPEFNQSYL